MDGDEVSGQCECAACSKIEDYVLDQGWHQKRCGLASRKNLMRIHIVGGPGSGKTTLASEIAAHLGVEVYELDKIAFTGPHYVERPLMERLADVDLIAQGPSWVTEGLFLLWTDKLLSAADVIVWLDHVRWRRSVWRVTQRFIASALREVKDRRGLEKFMRFRDYRRHLQQLIQVFFSSRAYYATPSSENGQLESREHTVACLATFKDKVVHCSSDEAVDAFLHYVLFCLSEEKEYG